MKFTDAHVQRALIRYPWPGNVRELKNIIEYLVNIKESGHITLSDLPEHLLQPTLSKRARHHQQPLKSLLAEYEKTILADMLTGAGNVADKRGVARTLGISLATLYRKMVEYDL